MDIGQLWVTLGVNLAGLNAAYAAFGKLEGAAEASLGKITGASEAAAKAQTAAAISSFNAQIALDNRLMIQRIKAVERRVASEKAAEDAIIANRVKADLLFDKLAAQEMARQQKVMSAQIAASNKAAQAQIAASNASSAAMATNVNRMSLAFTRFGQSMTMYVTAPLLLIGYGAIKAVTDIDALEHKIVALTSTSQAQMNAWRSDIRRMSDETNVSAKDITESFYFVANSALSAGTTLKIVELASKASAIGMGTASDVGKALTFIYNAYGESAFNAAKTMDILTIAIREGVVEINQIIPVIGPVLPFAAKLGVSFDQVAASIAIMTRTGFSASRAATSIRALLQGIADPAPGAQSALRAMGTSFEELRAIIRDQGLVGALVKIDGLIAKFGETASGAFLKNIRAEMGALGQIGPQMLAREEVGKKAKEEAGSFARAWEIAKTSVQYSLAGVKVAFQNIFLSIGGSGGGLIKFFNELKDKLNGAANWFRNLTPAMQQHYIHLALWLAAIGPIILFVGNLIRVLGGLYAAVTFLLTPWPKLIFYFQLILAQIPLIASGFMSVLGVIGITNPWIGAAIAIGLVVAALTAYLSTNKEVSDAQQAVIDVNTQVATSAIREKVQIDQLVRVAQSHNATLAQKEDAIKKLNAMSPEYLGSITKDSVNTNIATEAIKTYIKSLQDKVKAQAIQEKMVENEKNYINDVMSGADKALSTWQKFKAGFTSGNTIKVTADTKSVKGYGDANADRRKKSYEETNTVLQGMLDSLTGVTKATEALNAVPIPTPDGESEAQKKARLDAAIEAQKAQDELIKKRKEFIQSYNESYNAIIAKANVLGDTVLDNGKKFDKADALNALYFSTMESGFKIFKEGDSFMNAIIANVFMLGGAADFTSATMKTMKEELAATDSQYKVSGDTVAWMTEKLAIFNNTRKALATGGVTDSPEVKNLTKDIIALNKELSGATLNKALADAAMSSSLLGGSFDVLGAKTTAYTNNLEVLKSLYALAKQNNDEFTMSLLKGIVGIDQAEVSTLQLASSMKAYKDATTLTNTSSETFGRSFDYTAARIKDTETLVNDLNAKLSVLTTNNGNVTETQNALNESLNTLHLLNITKATEDYSKALEANGLQAKTSGKSYNLNMENLKSQLTWLKEVRAQLDVTSDAYARQSDAIMDAEGKLDKKGPAASKILSSFKSAADQFMSSYVQMVDAQQNRALTMIDNTAKALSKSDEWVLKEKQRINDQYGKKKKQAALAEVAVNTAIGITKAFAELGPWGFAVAPLILAAGLMQISAINAAQMAEGGIVPSGYNNDTYPAMLTSGEVVVPPGKLSSIQGGGQRQFKPVVLRVEGRDLVGVLEEMGTLSKSF